jgi:dTDP-4-dehydrorhamnose 3,5-epimerase
MTQHKQVESALQSLQQELMNAGHWSEFAISAEALASQQPFCLDTMNFSQWLQFVFIPNMQALIETKQILPSLIKDQGLGPMATEFYTKTDVERTILVVIFQIDELLQQD